MKLIALTGLHGAGKDTVADALPARKLAFADVLYREVAQAFSVTVAELKCRDGKEVKQERLCGIRCRDEDEYFLDFLASRGIVSLTNPRSPRQILQWWADYRKAYDPDYFVSPTRAAIEWSFYSGEHVVVSDLRWPNQHQMIRQLGGQIWQVVRQDHEPPRTGHASETNGDEFSPDVFIFNDGSIEDLKKTAIAAWNDEGK